MSQSTEGQDLDFQIEMADNKQDSASKSTGKKADNPEASLLSRAANPTICVFHVLFKALAVACYLLLSLFNAGNSLVFIIVTILSAFDFWVVKNLSGRILVGLRWWSRIKEDGTEEWMFESLPSESRTNKVDSWFFWGGAYGAPTVWGVLGIFAFFGLNLNSVSICFVGLLLTGVNLYGYVKCQRDHKKSVTSFLMKQAKDNISQEQMNKVGTMAAKEMMK